ncbi:MAG: o-succinylbenzoate--CoA ligase [Myxococcota bacterium]
MGEGILRWTGALAARGVGPGDVVAVLSRNRAEVVFLFHAVGQLGAALAPLNTRLTAVELAPMVERLRPRLLFADKQLAGRLAGVEVLEGFADGAAPHAGVTPAEPSRARAILFTSGTSGTPKAAVLTSANLLASARASAQHLGPSPPARWLACLPLFHIGGLAMLVRAELEGGSVVLHDGFDPERVNAAIDGGDVSHVSLVGTTLAALLEARGPRRFPSSLRVVLVGGGPVSVELLSQARELGAPALHTYGLTEASSQVATERPAEADGTTCGPPLPGTEVRVTSEGEIEVRGPTVMQGYLGEAPLGGAWFRTGDLGSLDERGRLTVLARRTDLILSGGENVYPAEIEAVLSTHPGVTEVAVVGAADARWGQTPWAFLVARGAIDSAALERHCRARLAGFKVPRRFEQVEVLPRNASGKIDRRALESLAHVRLAAPARSG